MTKKKILILGSGIQGISAAFALYNEGYDISLIEKENSIFNMTSLYQEGRVHLGFTYGLDESCETGKEVMRNSYSFSILLDRWLGKVNWKKYLMPTGYYLVHKNTFLPLDKLIDYYDKLENYSKELFSNNPSSSYFNEKPKSIYRVLKCIPATISSKNITHVIKTVERVVEMFYLRDLFFEKIKKTKINILLNTEAIRIEKETKGFTVICKNLANKYINIKGDIVVNCLWNNRIKIDKTIGVETLKDPLYRFKIGILGRVDTDIPTCSIITGVFGNISPRLDRKHAYISWHEECMKGIRTDGITPREWEHIISNPSSISLNSQWIKNTIQKTSEFVPSLNTFRPLKLLPGIICSAGKTDIGDKTSKVHQRGCNMGVYSYDNYYSIDTGKFSSAPHYANALKNEIINKE